MDVGSRSHKQVTARLDELQDSFNTLAVNQTTAGVPTDSYERARERVASPDRAVTSLYVAVRNDDDDVLVVDEDTTELVGPIDGAPTEVGPAVCSTVRERTGVDCTIVGIERATILGLRDDANPDRTTVYQLVVELAGVYEAGDPGEGATWDEAPGPTPIEFA
jgi:hypothetical protein